MRYGDLPKVLEQFKVDCNEMMFYQYLPIKLAGQHKPVVEQRLNCFNSLIGIILCDYIGENGLDAFISSFVYLTAKYLYQPKNCPYNRPGWHSDGFMTDDINYIWCDRNPTVFNSSYFKLTMDDTISLEEMEQQAFSFNDISYPENTLLRLNQYNIHKVADQEEGMRTFLKISFSRDKYNLIGNSHNYLLDYQWQMKPRGEVRNQPNSDQNPDECDATEA